MTHPDFPDSRTFKAAKNKTSLFRTSPGPFVLPENLVKVDLLNVASNDMAVNGAATPVVFKYTVPAGKVFFPARVIVYFEGATNFSSNLFADIGVGPLANGVEIACAGTLWRTWKDNVDVGNTMYDADGKKVYAKDTKSISGRWTFVKEMRDPIKMVTGEEFSFTINDDLSALIFFRVTLGGEIQNA